MFPPKVGAPILCMGKFYFAKFEFKAEGFVVDIICQLM